MFASESIIIRLERRRRTHTSENIAEATYPPTYKRPHLNGTVDITTANLNIRKFKSYDAEGLAELLGDDDYQRYFMEHATSSVEDAESIIASWRTQYKSDHLMVWCIALALSNAHIGNISATVDETFSCAEIEYAISPSARGRGLATEALNAVTAYLHDVCGVHRCELQIHIDNDASQRVAEKAHYECEGIRRDGLLDRNGQFYDVVCYSHLDSDG